ncbi:MAG: alpha-L-fucosidase [Vallitalea sp.]|jgi:alpha-L-fucosidase|nr:alpha-L-fucosidase [Vallitalea sp.]
MTIRSAPEMIDSQYTNYLDFILNNYNTIDRKEDNRLQWWKEAKFGLFIHWGLYSKLAGRWKDKEINGLGEWIMYFGKIPIKQYEVIAQEFNPSDFKAHEWVKLAKDTGMKYLIITSKHHDGFAMYHSKCSKYNIVDATPFNRDPLKELANECHKQGIKLCFYYSHAIDFHHPHAFRNDIFHPNRKTWNFEVYLEEKVKPQLRELLTNYGEVSMIWFDMPEQIEPKYSKQIKELVLSIQPECLIGGRLGHGYEDYVSMGDNEYPEVVYDFPWESVGTINDTWGYKEYDINWKSSNDILRLLTTIIGRGGNYNLNLGPTSEGVIPKPSCEVLKEIGEWMKKNGEAIYGCQGSPLTYNVAWGAITTKTNRIYLHVYDSENEEIELLGICSRVKWAKILSNNTSIDFQQIIEKDRKEIKVKLPQNIRSKYITVIVLEFEDEIKVEMTNEVAGYITLVPSNATVHRAKTDSRLQVDKRGIAINWVNVEDWLSWEIELTKPGDYEIEIITRTQKYNARWKGEWFGQHQFLIEMGEQRINCKLQEDKRVRPTELYYYDNIISKCGKVRINKKGKHQFKLKPIWLNTELNLGPKVCFVQLKKLD